MAIKKQPRFNSQISKVAEDCYDIKIWVAEEWLPIIGPHGILLYNLYAASADKEQGNKCVFSIRTLEEFTFLSNSTIITNNWLLETCGLIQIVSGINGFANEYTVISSPPHVTPETLKPIMATLKAESNVGQNWQVFKANALKRILKWKPLHQCGRISQLDRYEFYNGGGSNGL
jgi:hypothetical protein